ncbi:MAG: diacylglycerol kinase family protein [Bacillota bacterium]|nr:diacylglycerol kinase family protein [Bacillota bacterium]
MRFLKSLKFAFCGFAHAINYERNMRIHTVFALYVLVFAHFFNLSRASWAVLLLLIAMVLFTEMINTCFEELCDMLSKEYNHHIRIIKDVAAGSVLVFAVFAVIIGFILFWRVNILMHIIHVFLYNPMYLAILILSLIISAIYVHLGPIGIIKVFKNKK